MLCFCALYDIHAAWRSKEWTWAGESQLLKAKRKFVWP